VPQAGYSGERRLLLAAGSYLTAGSPQGGCETSPMFSPKTALALTLLFCQPALARRETVSELGHRASELRELPYRTVVSQTLSHKAMGDYLRKLLKTEFKQPTTSRRELFFKHLKLMPQTESLPKVYERVLLDQIRGLYDPAAKRYLVVKGGTSNGLEALFGRLYSWMGVEMQDVFTVHELVHAIQDQQFNLTKLQKSVEGNFDRELALQCLVEGDATSAMTDYMFQRMGAPLRRNPADALSNLSLPSGSQVVDAAPRIFREGMIFPYFGGQYFVETLRERGGWQAVDRAYRQLPESSEQLLHPKKYPKERPLPVTLRVGKMPGMRSLGQDTAGEFTVRVWARENDIWRGPAAGWGGDRYEVWQGAQGSCLVWATRWDTPGDAREFADLARKALGAGGPGPVWDKGGRLNAVWEKGDAVQVWVDVPRSAVRSIKGQPQPF
jgi:hypothetical protein